MSCNPITHSPSTSSGPIIIDENMDGNETSQRGATTWAVVKSKERESRIQQIEEASRGRLTRSTIRELEEELIKACQLLRKMKIVLLVKILVCTLLLCFVGLAPCLDIRITFRMFDYAFSSCVRTQV